VQSIGPASGARVETRGDGWFGVDIGTSAQVLVTLSNKPASISGAVSTGGKPVAGAAIYLELFDPQLTSPRVRLIEARTDAQGAYRIGGLAPGRYRILSSFDFDPEDRLAMDRAAAFSLREGENITQALDLALP
jgi:hypothetical protein